MSTQSTQTIVVEQDLPYPPAKVWRVLTEPALIERWLMKNDFAARVGLRFNFHARPMPGWNGVVDCEVLEVEPERRLRYSWKGGSDDAATTGYGTRLDTVATFTLTPTATGTHLKLEHSGFTAGNAVAHEMMSKGWREKVMEQIGEVAGSL